MASQTVPNYTSRLFVNISTAKDDVHKKFQAIKDNLDQKEKKIMKQIDEIFEQNGTSIRELLKFRAEIENSKEKFSNTVGKSNLFQSYSFNLKEINSMLENLTSQIENLTTIKYSWKMPEDFLDNLICIDGKESQLKIDIDVAKGEEANNLSGNLSAMKIHNEKIYITDKSANALKVFKRDGEYLDSFTHAMFQSPGSMTILKNYLYVLTDQNTENYITRYNSKTNFLKNNLFKISTESLESVSIVPLNCNYGIIDTDGQSQVLLIVLRNSRTMLEKWNTDLLCENQFNLASPHSFDPNNDSTKNTRYQLDKNTVSFYDMKVRNNEIYILFSNSIYLLQSFDFEGHLLRVILQEDLAHDIVSLCLMPQDNGEIILRDETNSQILIFSYQGKIIRIIGTEETSMGMESPMCMDVDKRGNLVVCDGKSNWMIQDIPMQVY